MRPLEGIKVLDFSTVFAGPHCGQLLGDYGAEVIKIEPIAGDDARNWKPLHRGSEGAGTLFFVVNRNKKSLVVNLKSEEGIEIIRKLVRESDVLLQNFSAGVMDRLGLGYEKLKEENNSLIYCSISAFGEIGPMARARGYDPVIQAFSGMMKQPEEGGPPPARINIPLIDFTTGQNAFAGILAAIIQRSSTGQGTYLEVCLADSAIALQAWNLQRFWGTHYDGAPPPSSNGAKTDNVPYESFRTRDGYAYIACGNNRLWKSFCDAIGQPELALDPAYESNQLRLENYEKLMEVLIPVIASRTTAEWEPVFVAAGVPFAPINDLFQLSVHPQVVASNIIQEYESPTYGKLKTVARAVRYDGRIMDVGSPPPDLGEHTWTILRSLGYSDEKIRAYLDANIVGAKEDC